MAAGEEKAFCGALPITRTYVHTLLVAVWRYGVHSGQNQVCWGGSRGGQRSPHSHSTPLRLCLPPSPHPPSFSLPRRQYVGMVFSGNVLPPPPLPSPLPLLSSGRMFRPGWWLGTGAGCGARPAEG